MADTEAGVTVTAEEDPRGFVIGAFVKGADAMLTLIQMWLIESGQGGLPEMDTILRMAGERFRQPYKPGADVHALARLSFDAGVKAAVLTVADASRLRGKRREQFIARFSTPKGAEAGPDPIRGGAGTDSRSHLA